MTPDIDTNHSSSSRVESAQKTISTRGFLRFTEYLVLFLFFTSALTFILSVHEDLPLRIQFTNLILLISASLTLWLVYKDRRLQLEFKGGVTGDLSRISASVEEFQNIPNRKGQHNEELSFSEIERRITLLVNSINNAMLRISYEKDVSRALFSEFIDGIILVAADRKIILANRAAGELLFQEFKAEGKTGIEGRSIYEAVRSSVAQEMICRALEERAPFSEAEIDLYGVPPKTLSLNCKLLSEADREGDAVALMLIRDITRLRQLEGIKKDFVANVSHELKTPLTSMKGYLETLLGGAINDPAVVERFLSVVLSETERLNMIVDDLLELSRIEYGIDEDTFTVTDLKELVERVRSRTYDHSARAQQTGVVISVEAPPHLQVKAHQRLLEQAVVNLVDNALKYGKPDKGIEIKVEPLDATIKIGVTDYGTGIEAQHLPRIFERFYRVDSARSRASGGTGLGLSIVKHIANAHRGAVSVSSVLGEYTTFTITLPR